MSAGRITGSTTAGESSLPTKITTLAIDVLHWLVSGWFGRGLIALVVLIVGGKLFIGWLFGSGDARAKAFWRKEQFWTDKQGAVLILALTLGIVQLLFIYGNHRAPKSYDLDSPRCAAVNSALSSDLYQKLHPFSYREFDYREGEKSTAIWRVVDSYTQSLNRNVRCVGIEGHVVRGSDYLTAGIEIVDMSSSLFARYTMKHPPGSLAVPVNAPGSARYLNTKRTTMANQPTVIMRYQFSLGRFYVDVETFAAVAIGVPQSAMMKIEMDLANSIAGRLAGLQDLNGATALKPYRSRFAYSLQWWGLMAFLIVAGTLWASARDRWFWGRLLTPITSRLVDPLDQDSSSEYRFLTRKVRTARRRQFAASLAALAVWFTGFELIYFSTPAFGVVVSSVGMGITLTSLSLAVQFLASRGLEFGYLRVRGKRAGVALVVSGLAEAAVLSGVFLGFALIPILWDDLPYYAAQDSSQLFWYCIGVISGLAVLGIAYRIVRALLQRGAHRFLMRDGRPEVLYLRSFADDRWSVRAHLQWNQPLFDQLSTRRKQGLEELLVRALWRIGPVLAVGRPGERLQPLGAARVYVSDDQWQAVVRNFMRSAGLIVFVAGRSAGLSWELDQVVKNDVLTKTLIVFPPDSGDPAMERFAKVVEGLNFDVDSFPAVLGSVLPVMSAGSVLAALSFGRDGSPIWWFVDSLDDIAYQTVVSAVREAAAVPVA